MDDDGVLVTEAELAHAVGEAGGMGQRMPAGPRDRREVAVEIHECRPWDVCCLVFAWPALRLTQVPAHIGDADAGVVDRRQQVGRTDERARWSVDHRPTVAAERPTALSVDAESAIPPGGAAR